jgi:hypothetical protein
MRYTMSTLIAGIATGHGAFLTYEQMLKSHDAYVANGLYFEIHCYQDHDTTTEADLKKWQDQRIKEGLGR